MWISDVDTHGVASGHVR